ncbi:WD domain, G-beta repeat family protein [Aspergillus niger]|uniref:WD domain, G-beta repeat family protein n=2 Tax=Aspergillus niger TaxID=5061 RepID=A0A505IH03_ASPNG|nr:WD domain, G-beta repeat family protein [Aspergillus niger]
MWPDDIGSQVGSQLSRPVTYVITSFLSIALYNVVELTFILLLTFKRRKGLYFWSFVVATWGIAIYSIGFILKDFNLVDNAISYFYVTLIVTGWCAMVTGQSMVLYSRLHLVVRHHIMLRFILGMILCDVFLLQVPTIILCYGANSSTSDRFVLPYAIYERIQVTVFFIQEAIISGVYVYETFRLLRSEDEILEGTHREAARRLMLHLILMNIIVILLDIAILVLEWAGRYASQTAVKGFIYSVKLKLEFDILNQLVTLPNNINASDVPEPLPGWNISNAMTDTKEKPYLCTQCPKSFTRKDLLARHERLAHSDAAPGQGTASSPSVASPQDFDGLNVLASAVTDHPTPATIPGPQALLPGAHEQFTPGLAASVQGHPIATSNPSGQGPPGSTGFTEPFVGYGPANSYDGDDFTTFLDSIPLPSHPFSPTYQPLPLFPTFHFDSASEYSQPVAKANNEVTTPSSSILPRHGTQLPSLQPEGAHMPYKTRDPSAPISVTAQCRDRIVAELSSYSNVVPNPYTPSRHALSRCISAYMTNFHCHYPFMHPPTLDVDSLPLHLIFGMASVGAQYCREPETSMSLYKVAKAVTLEHIRRDLQWGCLSPQTEGPVDPVSRGQDIIETVQALLMLISVSCWFERDPPHHEALYIRSSMETLLRQGGLNDLPAQDGSWESWIRYEMVKRTKLIVFCFFSVHTIVFDIPPLILTEELTLDLPCTEREWTATSASQWLEERSQSRGEPKLQDAMNSLFTHTGAAKTSLESFSSLGGYVLIHAMIQNIWLIQKASRLPVSNGSFLSPSVITSLEQALELWCQCWEHNQESSIDPFNPHGPVSFTSTALLRLAYIRLNADFSSARRLETWNPDEVARSLKNNLSVQRSDRLTRAALHCAHALSTPIKLGINYVARTLVVSWSNQYALCSLECAVLLAKWLEVATIPNPEPSLTEQENKLLEFVLEMVMEAQHGVSREWLLANNTRLSATVTRLWARLFTADYIWQLVNLIGSSLNRYADILESDG